MRVVGLTGSIGMGKTTTAQIFRFASVPVHDADAAVHRLYSGAAVSAVEAAFPGVSVDGTVDRARLAERVLGDPARLEELERIVHPLVQQEEQKFLRRAQTEGSRLVVLDIPLLFETGAWSRVAMIVVVSAGSAVQRQRVLARPGMTEERFAAILARQVPDAEKRRRAHYVINTARDLPSARRSVHALLRALSTSG